VGGVIAVAAIERCQMGGKQRKVRRLFRRHARPVPVESHGHSRKTPYSIERKVDGVEFDVRERVQ
jgi:hypothetical protein